jgi:hypothetical protein
MTLSLLALILAFASGGATQQAEPRHIVNNTPSYCVDAETIRADIANGFIPDEQRYELPGAGWRVQQQHPNTALYASLKRIEVEGRPPGTMCQYSSHVGVVYMRIYLTANIDPDQLCQSEPCGPGPYWRAEWTESAPEQDRPGMEMMWVCTREDAAGRALPSRGCRFYLPPVGAPVPDVHGASGTTSETPPDDEAPW